MKSHATKYVTTMKSPDLDMSIKQIIVIILIGFGPVCTYMRMYVISISVSNSKIYIIGKITYATEIFRIVSLSQNSKIISKNKV